MVFKNFGTKKNIVNIVVKKKYRKRYRTILSFYRNSQPCSPISRALLCLSVPP